MTDLRPELSILPLRMRGLPLHRGYPVPWFVATVDGLPDFRIMDQAKFRRAIREKRCWVCGDVLGRYFAFVIGPMCAITRTTAEPPCHQECARWSAMNCPFLARPHAHRREDYPAEAQPAAGISIDRNPGVACVWTTRDYAVFKPATGGVLLSVGNPTEVEWFAEGRYATRAEVGASILSGFPALVESTNQERPERRALALDELRRRHHDVQQLWPAA
jgi:hypothetical protein